MRVETVNGRHLLCGHMLATNKIKHGQVWAPADGSDREVRVSGVRDGWVGYTWLEGKSRKYHEKTAFAFKCHYCLVLPSAEIPEELR